ncbi:MAG: hypothetical protein ACWA41_09825 [Putridiphycobacter sp.]
MNKFLESLDLTLGSEIVKLEEETIKWIKEGQYVAQANCRPVLALKTHYPDDSKFYILWCDAYHSMVQAKINIIPRPSGATEKENVSGFEAAKQKAEAHAEMYNAEFVFPAHTGGKSYFFLAIYNFEKLI